MKRLFLTLSTIFIALSASAIDIWVWNGGEYIKAKADSITFVDPATINSGEIVEPDGFTIYSNYKGTLKLTVMGFNAGDANPTVSVSESADNLANVAFSEFSASGYTISGFTAEDVSVTENADGSYSLSKTSFTTTANLNGESGELSKCSLTGSISASGAISLSISFTISSIPVGGSFSGKQ